MIFSSYEFLLFFAILFVAFRNAPAVARPLLLLVGSLAFYAIGEPLHVFLLFGSCCFNYRLGSWLRNTQSSTGLWLGVALNLAVLGWFKYAGLFAETASSLIGLGIPLPEIALPLAISFFSFQQIAYLFDCHDDDGGSQDSFIDYALFIAFFPQLIAGPIVHHRELIPQFPSLKTRLPDYGHVMVGLQIFALGLIKKLALANWFADYADAAFAAEGRLLAIDAWGGALAFGLQIYFDFSAYSDMAIGIAYAFGLVLPVNFLSPYKATSIIDFWRRWHVTLSLFLRDYLYFRLGGNRKGKLRRYVNLLVTMLLGGLWHGASWMFVLWGALHGTYLIINHGWRNIASRLSWHVTWLNPFYLMLTGLSVVIAWVPFRAVSLDQTLVLWQSMFDVTQWAILPEGYAGHSLASTFASLGFRFATDVPVLATVSMWRAVLFGLAFVLLAPSTMQLFGNHLCSEDYNHKHRSYLLTRFRWPCGSKQTALLFVVTSVVAIMLIGNTKPFIYFRF